MIGRPGCIAMRPAGQVVGPGGAAGNAVLHSGVGAGPCIRGADGAHALRALPLAPFPPHVAQSDRSPIHVPPAKPGADESHVRALMRIAPYLWPKGETELRVRVVAALDRVIARLP